MKELKLRVIPDFPMIKNGDDLVEIILESLETNGYQLVSGDILVIAQKIVSKAEGRLIALDTVRPSQEAETLAHQTEKDPRLVQLILNESAEVMRSKPGVIIVRHKLGHVGANAGIDQSNIEQGEGDSALLLPENPDESASLLKKSIDKRLDIDVGIIIADSMNRPWRLGTVGEAIGCAGIMVLDDRRGETDLFGRELKVTLINRADAIAAFATLAMGETTEKTPLAIISGWEQELVEGGGTAEIMRPIEDDLFN